MRIREFLLEEDGVGVIEVIVFKSQINKLLTSIFSEITKQSKEVY